MSNIFKYATSELSQDAFLCWLLSGVSLETNTLFKKHKNKQTYDIARKILFKFLNLENTNQEVDVTWVQKQWKRHIDIVIEYKINKEIYVLGIEDKTKSALHEVRGNNKIQTDVYRKELLKSREKTSKNISTIVYKTAYFTEEEKETISNTNKNEWSFYDIENIIDLFVEAVGDEKIESEIISSYFERLNIVKNSTDKNSNVYDWVVSTDDIYDICWEKLATDAADELKKRGLKVSTDYYRGTYLECWFGIDNRTWVLLTPRDWVKGNKRRLNFKVLKAKNFKQKEEVVKWINNLKLFKEYTDDSEYKIHFEKNKSEKIDGFNENENLGILMRIEKEITLNQDSIIARSDLLKTLIDTIVKIFDCMEQK